MASSGRAAAAGVATASICAFAMIATQVAGKATRDALFLSNFHVTSLPLILIASASLSIVAVLATARGMSNRGPFRVIPPLFIASGILMVGEYLLAARYPRPGAIVVYLHIAGLGSILISGFWSIINEHFDPRTARLSIGRIVGAATAGGLFGGLLAERVAAMASLLWVLPVIAGLNLICGVLLHRLRPAAETPRASPHESAAHAAESGFRVLARVGYLRNLALIVLLGNVAATLIDYLFKAHAAETFAGGAELVRFFAVFYTAVSVLTLVVQAGMAGRLLQEIGIANTMAVRPGIVAVGGLVTLPLMGMLGLGILRALESVVQSSLFRSGYELLFTPVVPGDKRSTKQLVDVGADRMGDVVGGAVIRAVILLPVAVANHVLMILAVGISVIGFFIARALRTGYIRALEASLINRAGVLDLVDTGPLMRSTLMESGAGIDLSMSIDGIALKELRSIALARTEPATTTGTERARAGGATASQPISPVQDPEIASLMALRSGQASRVHAELRGAGVLSPVLAAQVISLLAWDDVTGWAARALSKAAPSITGQLIDRMLDPDEDFAVRRRIPRVLATCTTQRAFDGLMAALSDKRFEVRFQAALALARIHVRVPAVGIDTNGIYTAVTREAGVDRALWNDQELIDQAAAGAPAIGDAAARSRSSRRMEYVFTILSLVVPRAPLQIAYKGLLTDDAVLRGTGLEYMESVLPREIWSRLEPLLDDRAHKPERARPQAEVLDELMRSSQSIELNLEEIRKRTRDA